MTIYHYFTFIYACILLVSSFLAFHDARVHLENGSVAFNLEWRSPSFGSLYFRDFPASFPRRTLKDLSKRQGIGAEAEFGTDLLCDAVPAYIAIVSFQLDEVINRNTYSSITVIALHSITAG